jgi:hypothetical protein
MVHEAAAHLPSPACYQHNIASTLLQLITSVLLDTFHCPAAGLQYDQIAQEIDQIEGVVTHGLLLGVADAVVVADPKQGVRVLEPKAAAAAAPSSS